MEVLLPQTMLQKLLDLLKLESFRPHQVIAIQSVIQDQKVAMICTHIDYHNQHERAALIGLFHATASVLTSAESYWKYQKPTQRGVQGYLSSLQRRVYNCGMANLYWCWEFVIIYSNVQVMFKVALPCTSKKYYPKLNCFRFIHNSKD